MMKLKLYDFWAPWCAPCKAMAPHVEALAEKYKDKIELIKVNIDENEEMAVDFGIQAIPTLVLDTETEERARWVGGMTPAKLELELTKALEGLTIDGVETVV